MLSTKKLLWTWALASLMLMLLVTSSQGQSFTTIPRRDDGNKKLIRSNPNLNPQQGAQNNAQMGQPLPQNNVDPVIIAPPDPLGLPYARRGTLNNEIGSDRPWWNDQSNNNGYPGNGYYPVAPGIYVPNPYESYFRGTSQLIRAQGQYGLDYQRARLLNQDVERSRYQTQYEKLQLELYRRSLIPTKNEIREQQMAQALRRARNSPPLTEILNANALNVLLQSLNKLQGKGVRGPSMEVSPAVLGHVNVTTSHGGNIGLLRNEGKLVWPFALRDAKYREARTRIDQAAPNIVINAQNTGTVDEGLLKALRTSWETMDKTLEGEARNMDPTRYIAARRYLNLLKDALRALEDPAVGKLFTKTLAATGKTVGEVVANMREGGLKFAPAVPGDEAYYRAWYNRLRDYEDALTQLAQNR